MGRGRMRGSVEGGGAGWGNMGMLEDQEDDKKISIKELAEPRKDIIERTTIGQERERLDS